MYYVYVIESMSSGKWYIGYSADLKERVAKHNRDGNTSTSKRGPWKVIYYEAYLNQKDALGREKFLKSGSGWRYLKKQVRHYLQKQLNT
ncbi:GIY-YIG nuclease family protein [Candidatus Uhrbacteria bacterium]|nr:GIY-YIG nuclease family protein [Candidatus Uhrbacteria bacterium]